MRDVTAVVFDYGNVLCTWDAEAAMTGAVDALQWREVVDDGSFARWNRLLDIGVPITALVERIGAPPPGHPDGAGLMRAYWERFSSSLTGAVPGTEDIAQELADAGVALYLLTNFNDVLFARYGRPRVAVLDRFDGIVVSGQEGVAKPDPEIYHRLLRRYGLTAGRTLFVDDAEDNVRAARAVGLCGHRFTDARSLRHELVERGLLVSALD